MTGFHHAAAVSALTAAVPSGILTRFPFHAKRPKRAKVQVSLTGATAQTIQISNNAKDANPAWVPCEPDQVVELPNTEKITELWELGVKISAQGEDRVTCGEPVAIVETEK